MLTEYKNSKKVLRELYNTFIKYFDEKTGELSDDAPEKAQIAMETFLMLMQADLLDENGDFI